MRRTGFAMTERKTRKVVCVTLRDSKKSDMVTRKGITVVFSRKRGHSGREERSSEIVVVMLYS